MKTTKVNHVVLTLKLTELGMGMPRDEVDELVNRRLSEGYDEVDIFVPKVNLDERQAPNDIVLLYIFKAYEKETAKSKKND